MRALRFRCISKNSFLLFQMRLAELSSIADEVYQLEKKIGMWMIKNTYRCNSLLNLLTMPALLCMHSTEVFLLLLFFA